MMDSSVTLPKICVLHPSMQSYPLAVKDFYGGRAPSLYLQGNLELLNRPGLGFCGSRKATDKGLNIAADCADQAVSRGFVAISGNAAGIDNVVHHSALSADDGETILILPEGIDHFRIRKNLRDVWDWERTLVVSQFEPNAPWKVYRAMERNKLIIALSRAMIVVEAGVKGGTMDAGLSALKSHKPLFVAKLDPSEDHVLGNDVLLEKGAIALSKSKSTGRANIEKLEKTIGQSSVCSFYEPQMGLF